MFAQDQEFEGLQIITFVDNILQRIDITKGFAHFGAIDLDVIGVHPGFGKWFVGDGLR